MTVVFYVSGGDADLKATAANLKRAGKRVKHDEEVHDDASRVLKAGKRSVVVAHGVEGGHTVFWHKSSWAEAAKWLWVDMPEPPTQTRIHLYSCYAALGVLEYLEHCEVVGHSDVVPFPVDEDKQIVLWFLHRVERLLESEDFDAETATADLLDQVDRRIAREADRGGPSAQRTVPALMLLRRSLLKASVPSSSGDGYCDGEDE